MTVQELFNQFSFDDIVKALQNTHRNDESICDLASYKEAFDTLCNIKFEGKGGKVTFDVTPPEHRFDPGNLPLLANDVEGDLWENIVGKEVVKPEDNPFTDAELIAAILWGATFYGFNPHEKWEPNEVFYTKYGERAQQIERKLYLPYLRNKRKASELKDFSLPMPFGVTFSLEDWDLIECRKEHQNRQKRKRYYRMEKRYKWLMKLDKRHHLIDTIRTSTGGAHDVLAERILNAKAIHETWYESHTYGKKDRIEYITDLIGYYSSVFSTLFTDVNEINIIVYTSQDYSLADNEYQSLKDFFASFFKDTQWNLLQGCDNHIGLELSMQFIGISNLT
ncbi:MAG: hypothetical protein K2J86_04545 [Prevotella sp.]|nr:hypothetical protein [Prevotella sp.]